MRWALSGTTLGSLFFAAMMAWACGETGDQTPPVLSSSGGTGEGTCDGACVSSGGTVASAGGGGVAVGSGGMTMAGGTGASGGGDAYDCEQRASGGTASVTFTIAPSASPPGGLKVEDTPLFVSVGFDDNSTSEGMKWAQELFSSLGARASFYHTGDYADDAGASWKSAFDAGMEAGYHTQGHHHGGEFSAQEWGAEIDANHAALVGTGIPGVELIGFRAPFLEYNDALLAELRSRGIAYDCSIEEGFESDQDGTNLNYPYTLHGGSPGHEVSRQLGVPTRQFTVGSHSGLFELPVYALVVPPDEEAQAYDFAPGLRTRISDAGVSDFAKFGYKITGFDWNLWFAAQVSGKEFLAILKYNLDLRRAGNRAPLLFGAHTEHYATNAEHREALADFVKYAVSLPEVRVVTHREVLEFMREPKALDCY